MKLKAERVFVVASGLLAGDAAGAESAVPAVQASQGIVVTASRREVLLRDTADIVQVIDRNRIERLKPSTTGELLSYATGAAISTGTGSGLPDRSVVSLNGLPPNYTLVLLNGVPLLSDHIHTGQNLDLIPPSSIERIEVVRGAASAQYGPDAIGGIVNIITRRSPDRGSGEAGFVAGSYGTLEGNAGLLLPIDRSVRISSFTDWESSDGLPLKAPEHRLGNMGYERWSLFNRIDMALGEDTEAFVWLHYVANRMDWRGGTADSTLATPVAGLTHRFTPSLQLAAQVSYSDWDAETNNERNRMWRPEAHLTWQATDAHTLMAGGEYRLNKFSRTSVEAPDQEMFGLFVQDEWSPVDRFSLMLALRYDKAEDVDGVLSPKVSASFLPADWIRLRASVGRGFHAPTLQELYEEGYGHGGRAYRFGNPDLDPETSTTYTAGVEVQPADFLKLMVYGFYSDLDDMIVPVYEGPWEKDPAIDVWRRRNIENATVRGVETCARADLGRHVTVEGGYTYTDNEDADTGRRLPYSPGASVFGRLTLAARLAGKVDGSVFVGVRAGFDRQAWNWKPAAGVAPDNPDGLVTSLEDYTKLDAGVAVTYDDSVEVFAKVENLLGEDIENLDDAYTVLDGEPYVRAGIRYRFPIGR